MSKELMKRANAWVSPTPPWVEWVTFILAAMAIVLFLCGSVRLLAFYDWRFVGSASVLFMVAIAANYPTRRAMDAREKARSQCWRATIPGWKSPYIPCGQAIYTKHLGMMQCPDKYNMSIIVGPWAKIEKKDGVIYHRPITKEEYDEAPEHLKFVIG